MKLGKIGYALTKAEDVKELEIINHELERAEHEGNASYIEELMEAKSRIRLEL